MADLDSKLIFYSDFHRFAALELIIYPDTITLGDEFHELFFD
jgi:hypothetical protein